MNFLVVLNQVLILVVILIVGVVAGKGIIVEGASKKLSELLLYITNPMLVLSSFSFEYSPRKCVTLIGIPYGSGFFVFYFDFWLTV